MDTKLKRDLRNADGSSQYDQHAKNVLSNKKILAHILHRVVHELSDLTIDEIEHCIDDGISVGDTELMTNIVGLQQEDRVAGEDVVYFDLRFVVIRDDKQLKILFDVEAQKNYYPGYHIVTRGILYCSRMLSAQVATEFQIPKYDDLKKVYSIWLCFNSPKKVGNAISRYFLQKEDILGHIELNPSVYDKLEIVQICLNENAYEYEDELIRLLNTVFSTRKSFNEIETIVESEYNIPMNDSFGEEVQQMCNLSEGIEQKGIEKGIQLGIQQGIQQGILTGYQSLHHLMQAKVITLDQALDAVENKDNFKKWLSLQK
ncbi:hypothetical protein [Faecalimonas umbilicata]|uniref:hypothetical protein n=1 Tax=Faecalimonas umbilicata TaxID=1912855 RepID=UPI0039912D00